VRIEIGREVERVQHRYAEFSAPIEIVFYFAKIEGQKNDWQFSDERAADELAAFNAGGAFQTVVWVMPTELPEFELLAANSALVSRLASGSLSLE